MMISCPDLLEVSAGGLGPLQAQLASAGSHGIRNLLCAGPCVALDHDRATKETWRLFGDSLQ